MQRLHSPAEFSVYMLNCANTDLHENSIPAAQNKQLHYSQVELQIIEIWTSDMQSQRSTI